jgi:hypothetical protein
METVLISVKQFLRQYTISRTSFYNEVKKGNLRILKRGRRTLVAQADADAWVNAMQSNIVGGKND